MAEISIEVAYATPSLQKVVSLKLKKTSRAREVLPDSGLQRYFPNLDYQTVRLGVWGQLVADDYVLQQGDRLELYRPLPEDPRERRRRIALDGQTM